MATIRDVRRASMPVIAVLALLIIACVVYIFSPAGRSRQTRVRQYQELQAEVLAKRQEVLPTRGMDNKLKQASADIDSFYGSRFPAEYTHGGGAGQGCRRHWSASHRGEV